VGIPRQDMVLVISKARDLAKELLTQLETQGHPQTNQSSALYLALVGIQKRLLAVDPPPPPIAQSVSDLEELVRQCDGKLAPVKALIEEALRIARTTR